MGAQAVDYRVSTLVVLCKDCGHDVGLYPARHKCQPVERPAMPALPVQYSKEKKLNIPGSLELSARTISSGSSASMASSPSPSFSSAETPTSKWSSRLQNNKSDDENEESVYFNNFAANLPETNEPSGRKLWGKVRQNDKWKQLSEKNEKPKQSGKLWGKLIQATQNMADKIPARDERGAESDEDDWEGETHVSRILREHYEKKRLRLPEWLFDENVAISRKLSSSGRRNNEPLSPVRQQHQQSDGPIRTPSRRRLWEQNPEDAKNISSRERERQELRQAQSPMPPTGSKNRSRYNNRDHQQHHYNEDRETGSYGRYSNNRDNYEDDQYSNNRNYYEDDYGRRSQPTSRDDDRYYDDRYKSNHSRDDDRGGHYSQGRDRYDTSPQTRGSRDQSRYYEDDHRYAQQLSPQQQQQRSNNSNRQKYYEENRGGYYESSQAPPKSERSTRGYDDNNEPRSNRHDQSPELDDYYNSKNEARRVPSQLRDRAAAARYNSPPEMARREPSIRSGGRQYGNDPNYF